MHKKINNNKNEIIHITYLYIIIVIIHCNYRSHFMLADG